MIRSNLSAARLLVAAIAVACAPLAGAVQIFSVAAGAYSTGSMAFYSGISPIAPGIVVGGDNTYGQKGVIAANNTSLNLVVVPSYPRSLAFGTAHVIAALDDGSVVTWGDQGPWLGRNAPVDPDPTPAAANPSYLRDARQVAAGGNTSYVLTNKGKVWSFGTNASGELGNGTIGGTSITPLLLPSIQSSVQVSAQCANAAIVDVAGHVYAWGDNSAGQLGQGAAGGASGAPTLVPLPAPVVRVAVGCFHMLAMTAGGQVYGWGRNLEGQLGLGNTLPQPSPVLIGSLSNIASIAVGAYHSVALVGDGTIRTFGLNVDGQLGVPGGGQQNTPQTPAGVTHVTSIAAGFYHTVLGVQSATAAPPFTSGYPLVAMASVGDNSSGQLARGTLGTDISTVRTSPWLLALLPRSGTRRSPSPIRRTSSGAIRPPERTSSGEAAAPFPPPRPRSSISRRWSGRSSAPATSTSIAPPKSSGTTRSPARSPSGRSIPPPLGRPRTTAGTAVVVDYASIGVTPPSTQWRPVAVGDIDGDGSADIIWRNLATGEISVWYLSATGAILRSISLGTPGTAWSLINTGDFDGNGIQDIFFRNTATGEAAAWLMSAVPGLYRAVSYGPVDLAYTPQLVTDMDGDGRSDIFWRNQSTGDNYIWYINGTVVDGHATVPAPTAWRAQQSYLTLAATTFAAIIWRNTSTGEVASWLYPGRSAGTINPAATSILATIPLAWQLTAQ